MSTWPEDLLTLLEDPLFDGVRPRATRPSVEEQLLSSLQEISAWVAGAGRLPQPTGNLAEKRLRRTLDSLRSSSQRPQLEAWDELGILSAGDDFTLSPSQPLADNDDE